ARGLAQHHGLRLNAPDACGGTPTSAPAEHPEAIDHGGVRVRPDQAVRVQQAIPAEDHLTQELKVHLVHDARAGGHDAHVVQRLGAPLRNKRAALPVPLKLQVLVPLQGIRPARE
ncbi:unnamed protein product, partial [Ixodes pacificus]